MEKEYKEIIENAKKIDVIDICNEIFIKNVCVNK